MGKLTEKFLVELFKGIFKKKELLNICITHLEFSYLPSEEWKYIWKSIKSFYKTSLKPPTIGLISQMYKENEEILIILEEISEIIIEDYDALINQLEIFIRESISIKAYEKFSTLYNQGEREKAIEYWIEVGNNLSNFSIKKGSSYFEEIFGNYFNREKERILNRKTGGIVEDKIPFSIDVLDEILRGGLNKKDTFLFLAQSGVGKTKFLRWVGVGAARRGFRTLHIQLEGSKQEAIDGYDATWTGQFLHDIESGLINKELRGKISKIVKSIKFNKGEIFVYAPEKFDTISLRDIRNHLLELEKNNGKIDLVLLDYFELIDPGDGKIYKVSEERQRREAISKGMKNIAVEFNVVFGTATQASTVDPLKLNDPDFVMTRYDISEFKGALKPFSLFGTFNQTEDEYEANFIRIFLDKVRKFRGKQIIDLYQAYKYDRFYDRQRTLNYYEKKNEGIEKTIKN